MRKPWEQSVKLTHARYPMNKFLHMKWVGSQVALIALVIIPAILLVFTMPAQTFSENPWVAAALAANSESPEPRLLLCFADRSGLYLANIRVVITDENSNPIANLMVDGPWLGLELAPGDLPHQRQLRRQKTGAPRPAFIGARHDHSSFVLGSKRCAQPNNGRTPSGSNRIGGNMSMNAMKSSLVMSSVLALVTGCASVAPPREQVGAAEAGVRQANATKASQYAPTELRMASDKLAQAQTAMREEKYDKARRLAEEALVEAQLAESKARTAEAQQTARNMREAINSLRRETERNSQGS